MVALRKESVDRNTILVASLTRCIPSLSARRAWIEIRSVAPSAAAPSVALRKESVDRNHSPAAAAALWSGSLSARRAWIEIQYLPKRAPRSSGRSPQGERG